MTARLVAGAAMIIAASALAVSQALPPAGDRIATLGARLERGDTTFEYQSNPWGYLPALLKSLDISIDSQVLVFSKTSIQQQLISPRTPRAIYFNDAVAVAWVQNGPMLELAALGPQHGVRFYTLDAQPAQRPRFTSRASECSICHGAVTDFTQGLMVTNSFTGPDGTPAFMGGPTLFHTTDHRTPFADRWGGWYVTGLHGSQEHMGNAIAFDPDRPSEIGTPASQNVTSLAGRIDTNRYLASTSDIVALMTLEHQTRMMNLIASVDALTRRPADAPAIDNGAARLDATIDSLVTYMLFADEVPLTAPVTGVSTFTRTFAARGPRDRQGRSLRDFDLRTRLFRFPLSYMIYSEAFDGLEDGIRGRIYRRLYDVLSGADHARTFDRMSADDRRAILEIVRDTKADLPDYWKAAP